MELSVRSNVLILNSGELPRRPGPAKACVDSWQNTLTELLPAYYRITSISILALEQKVASGDLDGMTVAAIVLPGGSVASYLMHKNAYPAAARGYQILKKWCEVDGVALICSCAGAIFVGHGCCDIDFKEVSWSDDFDPIFFNKWGRVGVYHKPSNAQDADKMACAILPKVVPLRAMATNSRINALFVAGPGWHEGPGDTIHARYEDTERGEGLAAILSRKFGQGTVVFIGPHLEHKQSAWELDPTIQEELRPDQDARQDLLRSLLRVSGLQVE